MNKVDVREENVDIVKTIAEHGRYGRWDLVRPLIADDIAVHVPASVPWGGEGHGWEGYKKIVTGLGVYLGNICPEPVIYKAIDDEEVLARTVFTATVLSTSNFIVVPALQVFTVRGGQVCEIWGFYHDTMDMMRP